MQDVELHTTTVLNHCTPIKNHNILTFFLQVSLCLSLRHNFVYDKLKSDFQRVRETVISPATGGIRVTRENKRLLSG